MKMQTTPSHPLPPRLTMDEYADFVSESVRHTPPEQVARQKQIEKCIVVPFRIPDAPIPGATAGPDSNSLPSGGARFVAPTVADPKMTRP